MYGKDSSVVSRTSSFKAPLEKNRKGEYKIKSDDGVVYTCMTSDFFLDKADDWRSEIWNIIKLRRDLNFAIITKRIDRFMVGLPEDWGEGYENVTVVCTCENQEMADKRLPVFLELPIKHREISCEPLLENIDLEPYLKSGKIDLVVCGGESGENARICSYDWILSIRRQCIENKVSFYFKQTGAYFCKDGKRYRIERKNQHQQARRANIDYSAFPVKLSVLQNQEHTEEELFPWGESFSKLFQRLSASSFRAGFHLEEKDKDYIKEKGLDTIKKHCQDFVRKRLAPAEIENDGKQTPMKGHPVFIAQHATGTCCRGCLFKWHGIPIGVQLSEKEQNYVVSVIMEWIKRQCC